MLEELGQFLQLESPNVIGTKWIFENKFDENDIVTRNKERLFAQGYTQIKDVDFDEPFVLVERLEAL